MNEKSFNSSCVAETTAEVPVLNTMSENVAALDALNNVLCAIAEVAGAVGSESPRADAPVPSAMNLRDLARAQTARVERAIYVARCVLEALGHVE